MEEEGEEALEAEALEEATWEVAAVAATIEGEADLEAGEGVVVMGVAVGGFRKIQ